MPQGTHYLQEAWVACQPSSLRRTALDDDTGPVSGPDCGNLAVVVHAVDVGVTLNRESPAEQQYELNTGQAAPRYSRR